MNARHSVSCFPTGSHRQASLWSLLGLASLIAALALTSSGVEIARAVASPAALVQRPAGSLEVDPARRASGPAAPDSGEAPTAARDDAFAHARPALSEPDEGPAGP